MFEPSWFIAGNVAVSRMNGFEDTEMLATYAEAEGGVCELVTIVGVISIRNNRNRIPINTFFLFIILRSAIRLKNLNSCLRENNRRKGSQLLTRF